MSTEPESTDTTPAPKSVAQQVSELAERAVILPIGASLIVQDDLISALRRLRRKYGTAAGLEKEFHRYEKRGARACNRVEKQVRAQRVRFERELRQCQKDFQKQSAAVNARVEQIVSVAQDLIR